MALSLISYIFVSSLIRFMTLDMYTAEVSIYSIKLSLGLRTCQAWGPLVYPLGGLCHSRHYFDIPENKANVCIREKS